MLSISTSRKQLEEMTTQKIIILMERSINQPHFNHTVAASAPIHAGLFYQYSAQYCSLATEITIIETMVKG